MHVSNNSDVFDILNRYVLIISRIGIMIIINYYESLN